MIITASTGMMRGEKTGLVTGFCCGLLADIFFADFIGLSALFYMYAGFFSGLFHRIFFPENYILPLAITIFNTFIKEFVTYMLLFLLRARFSLGHYMTHTIIPEVVYTAIIAVFLYPVILNINTWIDRIVQRGARKFV
jgi:rod shape-determining protein MreD